MLVSWEVNSPFVLKIRKMTARASRGWHPEDELEAFSEVWVGLRRTFVEGQIIDPMSPLIWAIVSRGVSTYFRSRGRIVPGQRRVLSLADPNAPEVVSGLDTPAVIALKREFREVMDEAIEQLTPRRAEAVRSRIGGPLGPASAGSGPRLGGTRQNRQQHYRRGIEAMRPTIERYWA